MLPCHELLSLWNLIATLDFDCKFISWTHHLCYSFAFIHNCLIQKTSGLPFLTCLAFSFRKRENLAVFVTWHVLVMSFPSAKTYCPLDEAPYPGDCHDLFACPAPVFPLSSSSSAILPHEATLCLKQPFSLLLSGLNYVVPFA